MDVNVVIEIFIINLCVVMKRNEYIFCFILNIFLSRGNEYINYEV